MSETFDLYQETRRLADDLEARGIHGWPERLREAINNGSTGGEIVMAIRWHLTQMLRTQGVLSHNYGARAEKIIDEANTVLKD